MIKYVPVECICGEINARNCPVHQADVPVQSELDTLKASNARMREMLDDAPHDFRCATIERHRNKCDCFKEALREVDGKPDKV